MGQAAYGACEMQENLSAPGAGGEGLAAPAPTALAVLRFYDEVTDGWLWGPFPLSNTIFVPPPVPSFVFPPVTLLFPPPNSPPHDPRTSIATPSLFFPSFTFPFPTP